ncbi:MAG: YetF domain-containing protein [Thermodesulfobacteriota bacterium]|jgi:uncharacterized membrane protein YcaP (DUF421 family)
MGSVIRVFVIYLFLLLIFRVAGRRTLSEMTSFDFVLLLIIPELTQEALLDNDHSLTNAMVMIVTLIGIDIGLSLLKQRAPSLEKWIEGVPLVIVEHGRPLKERMRKARVDETDVLTAARELQGLERMGQIKYAVLERSGGISIIPRGAHEPEGPPARR